MSITQNEVLYVLQARLLPYVEATKKWFATEAGSITGTYCAKASPEDSVKLYFKCNKYNYQSLVKYVSPFCFVFTKDLAIGNMLEDQNQRVEDVVKELCEQGLICGGVRVIAKENTHLLGTSKQVLCLVPEDYYKKCTEKERTISIQLSQSEVVGLLSLDLDKNVKDRLLRLLREFN